ncbi:MAG TPA: hypothetical protein VJZ32_02625 [Candidatus Bathyarchaeia archaeon]|nr:hypothetical protein [Candidatus Bathyarchaeia archaeon]
MVKSKKTNASKDKPSNASLDRKLKQMELKLHQSVSKAQLDSIKERLQQSISELELKLKESKKEAESLRSKINEIQLKSAKSRNVSQTEEKIAGAQAQLKIEIERLREQIAKSIPKTATEGARVFDSAITELKTQLSKMQEALAQSLPEVEEIRTALQEKIVKLQTDLTNSITGGEPQRLREDVQQLKSKINELEKELETATRRIRSLETPKDTKDTI